MDLQVSVPPPAVAGQVAELGLTIDGTDGQAFHLVSLHYVGPRPPIAGIVQNSFNWSRRNEIFKGTLPTSPFQHRHQVLIQHTNAVAITVAVRVYRLTEQ
jgi:hypothetical protein